MVIARLETIFLSGSVLSAFLANFDALALFERGGFLLLTIVCLAGFVWIAAPKAAAWLTAYLDRLEKRNEEHLAMFMRELELQREGREKLLGAIHEQTRAIKDMIHQLMARPCQARTFKWERPDEND